MLTGDILQFLMSILSPPTNALNWMRGGSSRGSPYQVQGFDGVSQTQILWHVQSKKSKQPPRTKLRWEFLIVFSRSKKWLDLFGHPNISDPCRSKRDAIHRGLHILWIHLPHWVAQTRKGSPCPTKIYKFTLTLTISLQNYYKSNIPEFYFFATCGLSEPRRHFIARYINIMWSPMASTYICK